MPVLRVNYLNPSIALFQSKTQPSAEGRFNYRKLCDAVSLFLAGRQGRLALYPLLPWPSLRGHREGIFILSWCQTRLSRSHASAACWEASQAATHFSKGLAQFLFLILSPPARTVKCLRVCCTQAEGVRFVIHLNGHVSPQGLNWDGWEWANATVKLHCRRNKLEFRGIQMSDLGRKREKSEHEARSPTNVLERPWNEMTADQETIPASRSGQGTFDNNDDNNSNNNNIDSNES